MNYSALIRPTATIIKVKRDLFLGKMAYWLVDEREFILKKDFSDFRKEKEEQNYKIVFVK